MITRINESKTLAKHVSWEFKCKFDSKFNVISTKKGIMINLDAIAKHIIYIKKIIFEILVHVVAKIENI